MEQTLKITNVLSDPTRYYIYQFIIERHKEVTVQEIADSFSIHPNVARLHLSKLEDVNMLISVTKKTGKGGRPSRLYRLSDEAIQLHFPYRDYQLLSGVAVQAMSRLGLRGKKALAETGKQFGSELIKQQLPGGTNKYNKLTFAEKINILKRAASLAGFYPEIEVSDDEKIIFFQIYNCPFKEIAKQAPDSICSMHYSFIEGMFDSLFDSLKLVEKENINKGCQSCNYVALLSR
jgi:predicted ArsR family transcriptional regulator